MALCYQQQSCTEAFIPSFAYLSDTHHPLSTLSPSLVFGFSPLLLGCNIPQALEEGTNMRFTPESIGFPPSLLLVSTLPRRKAQKLRFTRNSIGFLSLSSDTHNTPVRYPLHNFHTSPVCFCPPSPRRAISRHFASLRPVQDTEHDALCSLLELGTELSTYSPRPLPHASTAICIEFRFFSAPSPHHPYLVFGSRKGYTLVPCQLRYLVYHDTCS